MSLPRLALLVGIIGLFCVFAIAQQPVITPPSSPSVPLVTGNGITVEQDFIHQQFGEEFSLTSASSPYTRDVDGDGVEDLVIVARSKKPMIDAAEHNYRVVDPYYQFYGYGDPKLTVSFGSEDLTEKNLVILVVHGTGTEAWRAEKPKAKFVIINVPLKRLTVRRLQLRKKQVNAIFAIEADAAAGDSVLFWDGKNYKYQPIGTNAVD